MSFAKFASSTSPLSYRPPAIERPKKRIEEPWLPGAIVRVVGLPGNALSYDGFEVGDTFEVLEVEDSIFTDDPVNGEYWYTADEEGRGLYSNFLECIEE